MNCNARQYIREHSPLWFNKAKIQKDGALEFSHDRQFKTLQKLDPDNIDKAEFICQRARGAYIAAVYRPDVMFFFSSAVQVTQPSKTDVA